MKNEFGNLFEFYFNIGMISVLKEKDNKILKYIKNYKLSEIDSKFTINVVDENEKSILKQNIYLTIFKAFISGQSFINEFINSKKLRNYNVEYIQANLFNPFCENTKDFEFEKYKNLIKDYFDIEIDKQKFNNLTKKGEFLKADSIIVLSSKEKYYVLCLDNSVYINNSSKDYKDITNIKKLIQNQTYKKRNKSCFSNLNIQSGEIIDFDIDEKFTNYLTVFNNKEKGVYKCIQAGSYVYSFLKFINKKIDLQKIKSICLCGYTDEDFSIINISKNQLQEKGDEFLKNLSFAYKNSNSDMLKQNKQRIYKIISKNFRDYFKLDNDFMFFQNELNKINEQTINYTYSNFQNTAKKIVFEEKEETLRNHHNNIIKRFLKDYSKNILFLTANPGIGKTTAITEYLKNEESYIFFYVSPRIQVNKDIENKFLNKENKLYDDDLICISANSTDEKIINSKKVKVVNFLANNNEKYENIQSDIKFLNSKRQKETKSSYQKYEKISSNEFVENNCCFEGVLSRVCDGANFLIQNDLSQKIVITASIQSLKKVKNNKTTNHINKIFNSIKSKNGEINQKAFDEFSKKYKNVIFMIDEITGDSSGIGFFNEIRNIIFENIYYKLDESKKSKVNFKLIVADASITNKEIINNHFNTQKENDISKIYYQKINQIPKSLEFDEFVFKNKYPSVCINANSYPSDKLSTIYNIYTKTVKESTQDYSLFEKIDFEISKKAYNSSDEQIIIFVQDKKRLANIKDKLKKFHKDYKKQELIQNKDFIIINSDLSDNQKNEVLNYKNNVRYVFMTSSASRGISFEKTTKILVDVSRFSIENNLMEIIQVIYRGRGGVYDTTKEKFIEFFVGDYIYYDEENKQDQIIKATFSLMSLLITLKACIETRINGYSHFAKNNIVLIPIGEKQITTHEDLFIDLLSSVNRKISNEMIKEENYVYLENIKNIFSKIFDSLTIITNKTIFNQNYNNFYDIKREFFEKIKTSSYNLLDFKPFNDCYVVGNVMIFKVINDFKINMHILNDVFEEGLENDLIKNIKMLVKSDNNLSSPLKNDLNKILDLIYYIKDEKQSLDFSKKVNSNERFILIPINSVFFCEEFKNYFKKEKEHDNSINKKLKDLIKVYYQNNALLPISHKYNDFPFLCFKSSSMESLRKSAFSENYLLFSSEINIINLSFL